MSRIEEYTPLYKRFSEAVALSRVFVRPEHIDRLLRKGQITPQQAAEFRRNGAIGSHLENLERNDGFKGFNQTGVSEIIAATDPRRQLKAAVASSH